MVVRSARTVRTRARNSTRNRRKPRGAAASCVYVQVLEEMQASQPEPPGFLARKHTDDAGAVGIEVERVTAAEAAAEVGFDLCARERHRGNSRLRA